MNTNNPQPPLNDDLTQKFLPTKNMPSLISYYLGVFGLIPILGIPLSIAAIIFGYIGLKRFKANPTPGAKGHAMTGIVLGVVELVCLLMFTGLLVIASKSANRS